MSHMNVGGSQRPEGQQGPQEAKGAQGKERADAPETGKVKTFATKVFDTVKSWFSSPKQIDRGVTKQESNQDTQQQQRMPSLDFGELKKNLPPKAKAERDLSKSQRAANQGQQPKVSPRQQQTLENRKLQEQLAKEFETKRGVQGGEKPVEERAQASKMSQQAESKVKGNKFFTAVKGEINKAGKDIAEYFRQYVGIGHLSAERFEKLKTDPAKLTNALGRRKLSEEQNDEIMKDVKKILDSEKNNEAKIEELSNTAKKLGKHMTIKHKRDFMVNLADWSKSENMQDDDIDKLTQIGADSIYGDQKFANTTVIKNNFFS